MDETKLLDLARQGKLDEMLHQAEDRELESHSKALSTRFYQILTLGYLVAGDVPAARHVLQRAPQTCRDDPITGHLHSVVFALWNKQTTAALRSLRSVRVDPLGDLLTKAIVVRAARLHATAYKEAPVAALCAELELSEPVVADLLKESGTSHEPAVLISNGRLVLASVNDAQHPGSSNNMMSMVTKCSMYLRQPYEE